MPLIPSSFRFVCILYIFISVVPTVFVQIYTLNYTPTDLMLVLWFVSFIRLYFHVTKWKFPFWFVWLKDLVFSQLIYTLHPTNEKRIAFVVLNWIYTNYKCICVKSKKSGFFWYRMEHLMEFLTIIWRWHDLVAWPALG